MKKLAIISAGIIAIIGAPIAVALRGDEPKSNDNNSATQPITEAPGIKSESSLFVEMDSGSSGSGVPANNTNGSTTLNVNGQDINVPANGEVNKKITSDGQTTEVKVESHNSSSGDDQSSSIRTHLRINSRSTATGSSATNN